MSHRRNDAVVQQDLDHLFRILQFRGESQQLDAAAASFQQFIQKSEIDRRTGILGLRSGFQRIDERTFQMQTAGHRAGHGFLHHLRQPLHGLHHFLPRHGNQRRQETGHPAGGQINAHFFELLFRFAGQLGIESAASVDMAVDQSRQRIAAGHVDHGQIGFIPGKCRYAADPDDLGVFAEDPRIRDIDMRSQTVIGQIQYSVFSHIRSVVSFRFFLGNIA